MCRSADLVVFQRHIVNLCLSEIAQPVSLDFLGCSSGSGWERSVLFTQEQCSLVAQVVVAEIGVLQVPVSSCVNVAARVQYSMGCNYDDVTAFGAERTAVASVAVQS